MNIRRIAVALAAVIPAACECTSDGLELQREYEIERVAAEVDPTTLTFTLSDGRQFRGPYSVDVERGRVFATLGAASGEELRCRMRLARGSSTLDGARGKCELRDGITFEVELAPGTVRQDDGMAVRR